MAGSNQQADKLSSKTQDVLLALAEWKALPRDPLPDHHSIAVACGKSYNAADWAHAPLRRLVSLGLAEVVGRKKYGGRLYRITDKGRAALRPAVTPPSTSSSSPSHEPLNDAHKPGRSSQ